MSSDVVYAQCSLCKRTLARSVEGPKLIAGFNAGILFLLIVPFCLVGIVAGVIYKRSRWNPSQLDQVRDPDALSAALNTAVAGDSHQAAVCASQAAGLQL